MIARGKAAIARARDVYANLQTYQDQFTVEKNSDLFELQRRFQDRWDDVFASVAGQVQRDVHRTPNWGECSMVRRSEILAKRESSRFMRKASCPTLALPRSFRATSSRRTSDFYP